MEISIEQIKDLRAKTGAGVNAVREALTETKGDEEAAIKYLREKGLAKATKRADRQTLNGIIGTYVHGDNRMAVLVEVATETDFAARSEEVKKFANDIALHVAAVGTEYINESGIPKDVVDSEIEVHKADIAGKPAEIAEKILQGRLQKFYEENVLLHQRLFTNEDITVQDYINQIVAQIGEKLEVTKFVVMKLGVPVNQCSVQYDN